MRSPRVIIDWSKHRPPAPGELGDPTAYAPPFPLSVESLVVIHGTLILTHQHGQELQETAIALAEVNALAKVTMWIECDPDPTAPEPDIDRRMFMRPHTSNLEATVLHTRQGKPIYILHPFAEVERAFRTYRIARDNLK